ncbi:MAG TPA: DUF4091 domain-containing protein [Phycisphaerae bacterium]|nr:DUF4091 domain-containing protein [Phycisphaerae bacterium]HRY67525.1 DUF4091 domain-containing protein [Phycisphaerae bacterium]HSA24912.1 DUF4091 domain-containing protein [Phycisphaerae bacterium]
MRILPLSIVGLSLPIMAGCASFTAATGPIQVWVVPESVTVHPDALPEGENEVYREADGRVRLSAAVNETVAFQIVMRTRQAGRVTSVALDPLRMGDQTVGLDRIALFREVRVPVEDYPAWYLRLTPDLRRLRFFPDVLVPLTAPRGALPISLRAGECEVVWAEVRVPPGTPAGPYDSAIHITPAGGPAVNLAFTLEVWPFALPQTSHLAALATVDTAKLLGQHVELHGRPYTPNRLTFDDPGYQPAVTVLDGATHLLHEHRCSPILVDIQPFRRLGGSGEAELDWTDYDRLVAGLIDGTVFDDRAAAPAWPLPIDERRPPPELYGGWGSPDYERMLTDHLRQCVGHFVARRWMDQHYVHMTVPGRSLAERYRQYKTLGELFKQIDGRLRMVCPVPSESMAAYGWRDDGFVDLGELVAVWAVPASLADAEELARQRAAGRRTWLSPDRPPYSGSLSMLAAPVDARTLAWQAYRFGCDAILLPGVNAWADDGVPRSSGSEGCLLWPGKPYGLDGPVPSIRLKRLRRGLQDYEYLWLLVRNRRPGIARIFSEDLFPFGGTGCYGEHLLDGRPNGWVTDPTAWSLARKLMANELTAAIQQPASAPAQDEASETKRLSQQIEWARLTRAVRNVRVAVEGIRVQGSPGTPDGLSVTATVAVFNATRQAVSGRLTVAEAPQTWTQGETTATVQSLASARTARRDVAMKAPSLEARLEGVTPFKLVFTPEIGDAVMATGRLCILISQRLARPPTINGKLDDWPLGAGNVAGDFVLVGALDVPKQGRPSPDRLSQITTAFVAHDDEHLYIAFACDDDKMAERRLTRDNQVRYDGLWPTGEDLVEVVLDPSGKVVDPGELFHVVIKANGAVITQQGVPCLAPVARCEDWPARVTAAVDDQSRSGRWSVEIRIPLASLGPRAAFCGINFGRFISRLGEYGSWSGARRHLYAPVTLGNMYLPK